MKVEMVCKRESSMDNTISYELLTVILIAVWH